MFIPSFCLFAIICFNLPFARNDAPYEPKVGDVVFQSLPHMPLTDVIEGVTSSPYSHCGLVVNEKGSWFVLEAIGPVLKTPLREWHARGRGRALAAFRLRQSHQKYIPEFISKAEGYIGRPYDIHYDFDEAKIYCSELIYKAFKNATGEEMGKVSRLGELNWKPHVDFIRKIEKGNLPLDRQMITPRALSEAPQLQQIYPVNSLSNS